MAYVPFRCLCGVFDDVFGESIEVTRGSHVEPGNDPSDKELREGKKISQVHGSNDLGGHEIRCIPYQDRQSEVVDHEEDERRNDEDLLGGHQVFELAAIGNAVPLLRARLPTLSRFRGRFCHTPPLAKPSCVVRTYASNDTIAT